MNNLLELLKGGDLRSDGAADEVAEDVIQNPELFDLLFEGLSEKDDLVRGRTAHALEKISRVRPELFKGSTGKLIEFAKSDHLPFVLWHLAMLFVNLNLTLEEKKEIISTLFYLLEDKSVFVKTWSISSLTILAMENPDINDEIIAKIKKLEKSKSAAVRNRVTKALKVLEENCILPKGWSKIER
jgi:HEAT repeat protein